MRLALLSATGLSLALINACASNSEVDVPEAFAPAAPPPMAAPAPAETTGDMMSETVADEYAKNDPFLWLEEVEGEAALEWVRGENERSLSVLEADAAYEPFLAAATDIVTSNERIPYASVRDGMAYNFWQDETNVRGLWRRTSLESYRTETPEWETILDFDALSEAEDANWVYKGANCFNPKDDGGWLCMVSLSNGGKDAVEVREFDLTTKTFVEGGFTTPEAKQGLSWVDRNTMLVGTDWGGDGSTLTESGYPSVVKRWTRGTPLEEAETLYTGDATDVGVWPFTMELADGTRLQGAVESDTFFTSTYWYFPDDGAEPVQWPIPPKSTPQGIYYGKMLVTLEQDWQPSGKPSFKSGDLIAFSVDEFLETKALPEKVDLVFRPNEAQAVNGVAISKNAALLSINDTVIGKVLRLEPTESGWMTSSIPLPGTGQARISFADTDEEAVFVNYEGFLTPDSLLEWHAETGATTALKSLPAKFDTEGLVVEQNFATSADGTEIPYFVVRHEDTVMDGSTPTLLYGYGGFQISLNPSYGAVTGRLWLEEGGAYVLANIRGGGEFGPNWHQAGLKLNRQRIYDDFIAVGEDIISDGLTTPDHLGIMGGSNGGLLMGVMLNQRPDLWNAVVVQVPLLDMMRYHTLLAGASWVDEYGSPEVPEERAFLETISPYQNFDASLDYPTPFFVTSTKDDRVHPGHARKMAALFDEADLPFYYYENIDGGHSAAANQVERARRSALEFTYLKQQLMGEE
ncbi:MAG: prolyl oligopeptidase family serine peptidase [Pseudomonadota bacterium]